MTKAGGDSVITRLYTVTSNKYQVTSTDNWEPVTAYWLLDTYSEVLNWNVESLEHILQSQLQEIPFKSGVELEATLASLLPPQEVIESSSILLQESDNIFEMTPWERITIFKHLFGLLGIDEAKDILADKKKEIAAQRNLLADMSHINSQFRSLLTKFLENYSHFKSQSQQNLFADSFLDDIQLTLDTINIESFSWDIDSSLFSLYRNKITWERDALVVQQAQSQQKQKQLQDLQSHKQQISNEYQHISQQLEQTTTKIASIDVSTLTQLQSKKTELSTTIAHISWNYDFWMFPKFWYQVSHLQQAWQIIQENIQKAELIKLKISQQTSTLQQIQQQIKDLNTQEQQLLSQQKDLEALIAQGEVFVCESCGHKNCIPWTHNSQAQKQQSFLQQQIQQIQKQKTLLEAKIQSQESSELNSELETLKQFFLAIPWKKIQEDAVVISDLQQQIQELDRKLSQEQGKIDSIHQYEQEKIRLWAQQESLQKQLVTIDSQLSALDSEQDTACENLDFAAQIQKKNEILQTIEQLEQWDQRISQLLTTSREHLTKAKQLKEQEQIITDLYAIYSKELMLVVLQDFLPSLEQAINANLAQVVDYEIKFELIKKTGDKLELEIFVLDEKGQRQVKSLSWWQKTVLKLVWILSVATMMKSQFLFMDETINNLDTDAIAKIAELIKNFVTYHDMKYYVVTHAPQIQEMGIWTKTIEI